MRKQVPLLLAIVATVTEGASVTFAFTAQSGSRLVLALLLHAAAAGLSLVAGRKRRGGKVSPVENDAMLFSALFIPGFGPPFAWALPHKQVEEQEVENAHEVFERYEEHVRPQVPDYERSLFTGDFDRDLARELDAESYYEVLRNGNIDQKRNALRSLADMGEPKHLELVRRCLEDPEQEVTLYAYSEIERLGRDFEEGIEEKTKTVEREPANFEATCELADSYYRYALSGILDQGLSAYHFRIAIQHAKSAAACGEGRVEGHLIHALSLTGLGDQDAAREILDSLPPDQHGDPRVRIIRARIAYVERDFEAARIEADALDEAGAEIPPWLEALRLGGDEPDAAKAEPKEWPAPAPAEAPDREEMHLPEWDEEALQGGDQTEDPPTEELSPRRGESLPKARPEEPVADTKPSADIGDRTSDTPLSWDDSLSGAAPAEDQTSDDGFVATRDLAAGIDQERTAGEGLDRTRDLPAQPDPGEVEAAPDDETDRDEILRGLDIAPAEKGDADEDHTADEGFLVTRDLTAHPAFDPEHTSVEQLSATTGDAPPPPADGDSTSDEEQLRAAALTLEPGVAGKPSDLPDAEDLEQTMDELEERLLDDAARELGAVEARGGPESDGPFEDDGGTLGETADEGTTRADLGLGEASLKFDPTQEDEE